jgi:hypothetical protein
LLLTLETRLVQPPPPLNATKPTLFRVVLDSCAKRLRGCCSFQVGNLMVEWLGEQGGRRLGNKNPGKKDDEGGWKAE